MSCLKQHEHYVLTIGQYFEVRSKYVDKCTTLDEIQALAHDINKNLRDNFYDEYTVSVLAEPKDLLLNLSKETARSILSDMHDNHINNDTLLDDDLYYINDDDIESLSIWLEKFYNADRYKYKYVTISSDTYTFNEE